MEFRSLWTSDDDAAVERFRRALEQDDLAESLLAIEGASEERRAGAHALLDAWSDEVRPRLCQADPALAAFALRDVIAERHHLSGCRGPYERPENSALTHVLEVRQGLPLLVSAVWMEIGRRADFPVEGIGLPGHFVVRVGSGPGAQLVDAFAGGRAISEGDCHCLAAIACRGQQPWSPHWLDPVSLPSLCERALRNLLTAWLKTPQPAALYRGLRFLQVLRPGCAELLYHRARLATEVGAWWEASTLFAELLERFPESRRCALAERELRRLQVSGLNTLN